MDKNTLTDVVIEFHKNKEKIDRLIKQFESKRMFFTKNRISTKINDTQTKTCVKRTSEN